MICPECKGSKVYVGLFKSEVCGRCGGKGEVPMEVNEGRDCTAYCTNPYEGETATETHAGMTVTFTSGPIKPSDPVVPLKPPANQPAANISFSFAKAKEMFDSIPPAPRFVSWDDWIARGGLKLDASKRSAMLCGGPYNGQYQKVYEDAATLSVCGVQYAGGKSGMGSAIYVRKGKREFWFDRIEFFEKERT